MKKPTTRKILVPVDFSELSTPAIETARRLARRFGATIHLVHVHEYYYPAGFMALGAPVPMPMATFQENAAQITAKKLKALANKYGIATANCYIQNDTPVFNEVCKVARAIEADLIVTPTHGYTGVTHFFEGSNAERIVQHSPCPVYVVKQNSSSRKNSIKSVAVGIDKILVPVDFSKCSYDGLQYAIQFADRVGAKIMVLNVAQLGYAYTSDGYAMYDTREIEKALRKGAEEQMRQLMQLTKFGGVKVETAVKVGPIVDEICAFAQNRHVDLIITSTHGRTGFEHVLIGSTAEQVVRRASCPVLVVPSYPDVRTKQLAARIQSVQRPSRKTVDRLRPNQKSITTERLTKKHRKSRAHAFPERRKTNKFRESQSA